MTLNFLDQVSHYRVRLGSVSTILTGILQFMVATLVGWKLRCKPSDPYCSGYLISYLVKYACL